MVGRREAGEPFGAGTRSFDGKLSKERGENVWIRGIAGVALCAVGAVFIGQGVGRLHGSPMTGHHQYVALGIVVVVIGLVLIGFAARSRNKRRDLT
jgi:hypothetical protein